MSGWKIGKPAPSGGGFDQAAHDGHVLIFVNPTSEQVNTRFGESTPAAHCTYVACLTCDQVSSDVLMFGTVLVPRLVGGDEDVKAARLVKGEPTGPGMNGPWLPVELDDEEEDVVRGWLDGHAVRLPSGRIVVEGSPDPAA